MLLKQAHRLAVVRRLQDGCILPELLEHAAQRLPDQGVIVDHQNLHAKRAPRLVALAEYFNTRTKASASRASKATSVAVQKSASFLPRVRHADF
jgi:hypothetical protein